MNVPLLDLNAQLEPLRAEILEKITAVVDSTRYILGPEVVGLEQEIADYCRAGFGIGVASGTDALLASLMALGVGPGDLVVTTPYTFFATMGSILRLGAQPVFVDIDPVTFNLDPDRLGEVLADKKIREKIKVILPVHLYGQCADMDRIMALASENRIPVLEDAAQAIGSVCPMMENGQTVWRKAGAIGVAGCFSFFPSKNLGCMGDGGMVVTNDEELAEKLTILRNHGAEPKYYHAVIGGNFRLDALQAAILRIKLQHLPAWHVARRRNAARYNKLFQQAGLLDAGVIETPAAVFREEAGKEKTEVDFHIYNQYVIRTRDRDRLLQFLTDHGIGVEIYYPVPLHKQKCVSHLGCGDLSFPEAERAAAETLALPIYSELTTEMQEYVVSCIKKFYS